MANLLDQTINLTLEDVSDLDINPSNTIDEQTIVLSLRGEKVGLTTPEILIPCHAHRHSELIGLGNDDHPQYLTVDRATQLFLDLFGLNPTEGENIGAGFPVFLDKEGITLKFKTLLEGSNVTITEQDDTITIESTGGDGGGPTDGGTFP